MEKSAQLMFALQSPVGLKFGAAQTVESDRITFEMDLIIDKGVVCPFRMELTGMSATIMGVIRIERILPARGGLPMFIGSIVEMPTDDRDVYDGWRRDQTTGGVSRNIERDPEAVKQRISDQMRGSTHEEAQMVLDRMNKKSIYKRGTSDRIEGDPFGLEHETNTENTRRNHRSMRAALKASIASQSTQQSTPVSAPVASDQAPVMPADEEPKSPSPSPTWLRQQEVASSPQSPESMSWLTNDSTASAATPPSSTTPLADDANPPANATLEPMPATPESAPATPESAQPNSSVRPPLIVVASELDPIMVTIAYLTAASFRHDYTRWLSTGTIVVAHSSLDSLQQQITVHISLPSGHQIRCDGTTVSNTPDGTTVALDLTTEHQRVMANDATA